MGDFVCRLILSVVRVSAQGALASTELSDDAYKHGKKENKS